jgi:PPOX class probable F420-dependent enzyme
MSADRLRAFLADRARNGMLATTRRDGRPHVVPVWFLPDGDDLVFTTSSTSVKGRALRRDGRACLCVDDPAFPYGFAMLDCRAELRTDPDEVLSWATRIAARYVGEDRAEEFGQRNAALDDLLVRLHPDHVLALEDMAE